MHPQMKLHQTVMAMPTIVRLAFTAFLITTAASQTPQTVYTNHTVGDNSGWFFNSATNTSATNYSSWASNQTFNLGDFVIFKTSTNQTVIQTYSKDTFMSCSTYDASDNDTFQYDGGRMAFDQALTIPVPLTMEGPNYFFSDADDGVQCQQGLAFEIRVNHGIGLPPSLNQPPPPPYIEPPGPGSAESPPFTIPDRSQTQGSGVVRDGVNAHAIACGFLLGAAVVVFQF